MNDSFYGYMDDCIHQNNITWVGNCVPIPFGAGILLFSIDSRRGKHRRRHSLFEEVYSSPGRTFVNGQLFSSPFNWSDLRIQLEVIAREDTHISQPVQGTALVRRVHITIAAGLVDACRLLKQATVRREVVVQVVKMRKGMGPPRLQQVECGYGGA